MTTRRSWTVSGETVQKLYPRAIGMLYSIPQAPSTPPPSNAKLLSVANRKSRFLKNSDCLDSDCNDFQPLIEKIDGNTRKTVTEHHDANPSNDDKLSQKHNEKKILVLSNSEVSSNSDSFDGNSFFESNFVVDQQLSKQKNKNENENEKVIEEVKQSQENTEDKALLTKAGKEEQGREGQEEQQEEEEQTTLNKTKKKKKKNKKKKKKEQSELNQARESKLTDEATFKTIVNKLKAVSEQTQPHDAQQSCNQQILSNLDEDAFDTFMLEFEAQAGQKRTPSLNCAEESSPSMSAAQAEAKRKMQALLREKEDEEIRQKVREEYAKQQQQIEQDKAEEERRLQHFTLQVQLEEMERLRNRDVQICLSREAKLQEDIAKLNPCAQKEIESGNTVDPVLLLYRQRVLQHQRERQQHELLLQQQLQLQLQQQNSSAKISVTSDERISMLSGTPQWSTMIQTEDEESNCCIHNSDAQDSTALEPLDNERDTITEKNDGIGRVDNESAVNKMHLDAASTCSVKGGLSKSEILESTVGSEDDRVDSEEEIEALRLMLMNKYGAEAEAKKVDIEGHVDNNDDSCGDDDSHININNKISCNDEEDEEELKGGFDVLIDAVMTSSHNSCGSEDDQIS